jgi:colanic acid/amylovoran/stewartan biosynthesis glycosyltransferase WcaL/AmsK/CpsK
MIVIHKHGTWLHLTENWLFTQVKYLPEEVTVHIVCKETKNLDQFWHSNIHVYPNSPSRFFLLAYRIRNLIPERSTAFFNRIAKDTGACILHSHFGPRGWRNIKYAKKACLKHIVTFYGVDVNHRPLYYPEWKKRYEDLFARADCILCEGPYMASSLINLGCPKEKVKVHHLGIPIDNFVFKPRRWNRNESLRILIAASFREKKGIPYALEALAKLQNYLPIEVTIIGDASFDKRSQLEKTNIMDTIKNCNLDSKVRLIGYQPHNSMIEEAYKHHIFIAPSITAKDGDTEGGAPVSIIEMATTGMPIVSTKHCDIPNIIRDGMGLLTEERNISGLVDCLEWLVNHPEKWNSLTYAARKHIEKEFNAITQGNKLAEIYKSIL